VVQRPDFHSVIDYLSNYRISESLATYDTKLVMPRTVVPPLRDRTSESIKKKTVSVAWNGKEPSLYSFKEPTIQVLTRKRTTDCFALRAPRTRADYNAENGAQVNVYVICSEGSFGPPQTSTELVRSREDCSHGG